MNISSNIRSISVTDVQNQVLLSDFSLRAKGWWHCVLTRIGWRNPKQEFLTALETAVKLAENILAEGNPFGDIDIFLQTTERLMIFRKRIFCKTPIDYQRKVDTQLLRIAECLYKSLGDHEEAKAQSQDLSGFFDQYYFPSGDDTRVDRLLNTLGTIDVLEHHKLDKYFAVQNPLISFENFLAVWQRSDMVADIQKVCWLFEKFNKCVDIGSLNFIQRYPQAFKLYVESNVPIPLEAYKLLPIEEQERIKILINNLGEKFAALCDNSINETTNRTKVGDQILKTIEESNGFNTETKELSEKWKRFMNTYLEESPMLEFEKACHNYMQELESIQNCTELSASSLSHVKKSFSVFKI